MDATPERIYYVPLPRLPRQQVAALCRVAHRYARKLPEHLRPLHLRLRSVPRRVPAWISTDTWLDARSKAQKYGRTVLIRGSMIAAAVVVGVAVARL